MTATPPLTPGNGTIGIPPLPEDYEPATETPIFHALIAGDGHEVLVDSLWAARAVLDGRPGIQRVIDHLRATSDEDWTVDVVRDEDPEGHQRNCVYGHLFAWGETLGGERTANLICGEFEEAWATTYMLYRVNDGEHPRYQQSTPRERVIAYLEALRDGDEKTTADIMRGA